jgi:hypothetical protein
VERVEAALEPVELAGLVPTVEPPGHAAKRLVVEHDTPDDIAEEETLLELYKAALGMA